MNKKSIIVGAVAGMVLLATALLGYTFYKQIALVKQIAAQTVNNSNDIKQIVKIILPENVGTPAAKK